MASTSMALEVRKGRAWRYFALLALANLMWAAQGVAVKFLGRQLGPIAITFVPFWVTTLLLLPVLIRERRRDANPVKLTARDWLAFAIAGVGGQVLAQLGMTWGITKSLVSNAAILNLLIPVISAVLASPEIATLEPNSLSVSPAGRNFASSRGTAAACRGCWMG